MAFDYEAARAEGYSDAEIADHLAKQYKFDIVGARKSGYDDQEILGHLAPKAGFEIAKPVEPEQTTPGRLSPKYGGKPTDQQTEYTQGKTSNPFHGAIARAANVLGEGVEGVARLAEAGGDWLESKIPLSGLTEEQIKNERQLEPIFKFAQSAKNWSKSIGYEPTTKLSELTDNPLNAIPFIAERVISSSPDMVAAVYAMPAYFASRTNEILNDRLSNDNKTIDNVTIGDISAAAGAAAMEVTLERFATKHLLKGAPITGKTALGRVGKEVGFQSITEGAEEGIGYLGGTVGTEKGVDPNQLAQSVIEGAIVGGGLGGAVKGTQEGAQKYADYREKKRQALVAEGVDADIADQAVNQMDTEREALGGALEEIKSGEGLLPNGEPDLEYLEQKYGRQEPAPVVAEAPVEPAPVVAEPVVEEPVAPAAEVPPVAEERVMPKEVVLQNRDRSTPASVAQMQGIAAEPDYLRLGASNVATSGAPIVFGQVQLNEAQLGNVTTVTDERGNRYPMQYAVVDAEDMLASNNADGSPNKNYADFQGLRAIGGNGRLAGLQGAYQRGTAVDYRNELESDQSHGIPAEVISEFKNPVLVRLMDPDMVDETTADNFNVTGTQSLDVVSKAENDARRVNLEALEFTQDGSLTPAAVKKFIAAMPVAEQNELMTKEGQPTQDATARLERAIFQKAYNNSQLTNLAFAEQSAEAANIRKAMMEVAPIMMQLEGARDYDFRDQLNEAVMKAISAKRTGLSLDEAARQMAIDEHPLVNDIVQMFADNARSFRKIADNLEKLATLSLYEARQPEADMFGERPKRSAEQVRKEALAKAEDLLTKEEAPKAEEKKPEIKEEPKSAVAKENAEAFERFATELMGKGKRTESVKTVTKDGEQIDQWTVSVAANLSKSQAGFWEKNFGKKDSAVLVDRKNNYISATLNKTKTPQPVKSGRKYTITWEASVGHIPADVRVEKMREIYNRMQELNRSTERFPGANYDLSLDQVNDKYAMASINQIDNEIKRLDNSLRKAQERKGAKTEELWRESEFASRIEALLTKLREFGKSDFANMLNAAFNNESKKGEIDEQSVSFREDSVRKEIARLGKQEPIKYEPMTVDKLVRSFAEIKTLPAEIQQAAVDQWNSIAPKLYEMGFRFRETQASRNKAAQDLDKQLNDIQAELRSLAGRRYENAALDSRKFKTDEARIKAFENSERKLAEAEVRATEALGFETARYPGVDTSRPMDVYGDFVEALPGERIVKAEDLHKILDEASEEILYNKSPSTALATDQLPAGIGLKKSEVGINKLLNNNEYDKALSGFIDYYGNPEDAKEKLDYYKRDVDSLIKNGGKVYRAIYAASPAEINLKNPGRHWTTTDANFEDFFDSGTFYDAFGKGKTAYIIEAIVPPGVVTNEKVDISGNPNESEVNLASTENVKFNVYEATDRFKIGEELFSKDVNDLHQKHSSVDKAVIKQALDVGLTQDEVSAIIDGTTAENAEEVTNALVDAIAEKTGESTSNWSVALGQHISNAANDDVRRQQIKELQSVKQQMSAIERRLANGELKPADAAIYKTLYNASTRLRDDVKYSYEPNKSPAKFLADAAKALANGDIEQEVFDVVDYMYKNHQNVLDGLRLSVRKQKGERESYAKGQFNGLARIVRLFKETDGVKDPSTIRHELAHSLEQMMPKEARERVNNVWRDKLLRAQKAEKTEAGKKYFENVAKYLVAPSEKTWTDATGSMPNISYYQYISPSEFWAANAEPLLAARMGGAWDKFKAAIRGMYEGLKGMFGFSNKYAIHNVFKQVMDGQRLGTEQLDDYFIRTGFKPLFSASKHRNVFGGEPTPATWIAQVPGQYTFNGFLKKYKEWLVNQTPIGKFIDKVVYKLGDKHVDLKRVQKAIAGMGQKIGAAFDAYMRETQYHGRVSAQLEEYMQYEVIPLLNKMVKYNITKPELNKFLHARHAKEYNDHINNINPNAAPGMPLHNTGSGMSTEEAQAFMDSLSAEQLAHYKELADAVDNMVHKTQDALVEGQIEKQETVDMWRESFPYYVPLYRTELDYANTSSMIGRGFSTQSGFAKSATGSLKDVDDILSNITAQRERAVVRSEKGKVGRALLALAIQNPNSKFWLPVNPRAGVLGKANKAYAEYQAKLGALEELQKIIETNEVNGVPKSEYQDLIDKERRLRASVTASLNAYKKMQYEAKDARIALEKDMMTLGLNQADIANYIQEPEVPYIDSTTGMVRYKPNTIARNSASVLSVPVDGETRYIFFNPSDASALRMVESLKNLDADKVEGAMKMFNWYTRNIAKLSTQWNLVFGAINFLRDVQGAMLNLTTTDIAGMQKEVFKNIGPALRGIYSEQRLTRESKRGKSEWNQLWKEFQEEGGQTGFRDQFAKTEEQASRIDRELEKLQSGKPMQKARAVFDWISDVNETAENAVRLSAYKVAKAKFIAEGMSEANARAKAAELGKNLTVNFNRKGASTKTANALYAFFNAAVQGTARMFQTLTGPKGKMIMGGLVAVGIADALAMAAAGFDEDEPPEFIRQRNLIIPVGGSKYAQIPMPLGFNFFVNFGRIITELGIHPGKRGKDAAQTLLGLMVESVNPLGQGNVAYTLAPTFADPMVGLVSNKDAFGRPIYKEDQATNPVPGYLRAKDSASDMAKWISKQINFLTGGTDYQKGIFSPTPDQLEFIVGQLSGGVGREIQRGAKYTAGVAEGKPREEVAWHQVPVAGRFFGETTGQSNVSDKFYKNVVELAEYEHEIKGRRKDKKDVQEFLDEHPEAKLWTVANRVENQISELKKQRKVAKERGDDARIKKINEQITRVMDQFNRRYKDATIQ